MKLEHEKDQDAITMFVLRYEAKISPEAKANYLKRFERIMREEGVDMPLRPKSLSDSLYSMLDEAIANTDRCIKMLGNTDVLTESQNDEIIPPSKQA